MFSDLVKVQQELNTEKFLSQFRGIFLGRVCYIDDNKNIRVVQVNDPSRYVTGWLKPASGVPISNVELGDFVLYCFPYLDTVNAKAPTKGIYLDLVDKVGISGDSVTHTELIDAIDNYDLEIKAYIAAQNFITASILSTALSGYVTNTALTSVLASYVTNTSLTSTLASYVTSSSLSSTLASYVTNAALTSTLSAYVTNTSLTSTLAGYVTNSALTSTLASYVTNTSLTSTLAGYETVSAHNTDVNANRQSIHNADRYFIQTFSAGADVNISQSWVNRMVTLLYTATSGKYPIPETSGTQAPLSPAYRILVNATSDGYMSTNDSLYFKMNTYTTVSIHPDTANGYTINGGTTDVNMTQGKIYLLKRTGTKTYTITDQNNFNLMPY